MPLSSNGRRHLLALGVLGLIPWLGCGAGSPPPARTTAPAQAPTAEASPEPQVTVTDHMQAHFRDVGAARDAVIAGDLEATRSPMSRLASGEYGIETPNEWMSSLYDLQAEARRGAAATTMREVARSVARIAQRCGECHQAQPGGPDLEGDQNEYVAGVETLRDTMARHRWSADELWLGLVTPAHAAWHRGARALSQEPLPLPDAPAAANAVPPASESVDPQIAERLAAIRALGERATQVHTAASKAEIYGDLIHECGQCHAARRAK